jgi:hypothetical protein
MTGLLMVLKSDFNSFLAGGSYEKAKALQEALGELVLSIAPNMFVTLKPNDPEITKYRVRRLLRYFHASIDRKCMGNYYYRAPLTERSLSIGFVEHINSEIHYHLMMRVQPRYLPRFEIYGGQIWKQICPSGTSKLCKISTRFDLERISAYVRKETFKAENYENFVITTEFSTKPFRGCSKGTLVL